MCNIEHDGGWTVLYDDSCDFCAWLLSILLRWDRAGLLHTVALQGHTGTGADLRAPSGLPRA